MHSGALWQTFYWLPTPTLALLAGILAYRKLVREFPFFFSFVVVACLKDLASFVAYHQSSASYFYTYWISHLVGSLFMFLAAYELFIRRLFTRFYDVTFYRYLFLTAALVIVSLSLGTALGGIRVWILTYVIRTVDFLRVAVLLFFVALMLFMGRRWSRYEFGITLGLGIESAAFLITFALFTKLGPLHGVWSEVPVFAGDLACIVWLVTFLRPEKPTTNPSAPVQREVLEQAREWERTLKDSLSGKKRTP